MDTSGARVERRGEYMVLVNDRTGECVALAGPGVTPPLLAGRLEPLRPAPTSTAPQAREPSVGSGGEDRRESADPRPPSEAWYAAHYPRCRECGRPISRTTCFTAYNGSLRADFCSTGCGDVFVARENGR